MRGFSVVMAVAIAGIFYVVAWPIWKTGFRAFACFTGQ